MKTISCDYIIAGSGVAGLSSALYAARSGLDSVVIDVSSPGGQVLNIVDLENYPGFFPARTGTELVKIMSEQAVHFGAKIVQDKISSVDKIGQFFHAHTKDSEYVAPAFLIATGATHKKLGIPGEKEFSNRGVSYCAVCDGPFFRDKNIIVIGGGNSACSEALYLASLTEHVTILHRRENFRADFLLSERVKKSKNISVKFSTLAKEIRGTNRVQSVVAQDSVTGQSEELSCDAVFIFVGMEPCTELFDMLPKDSQGFFLTNNKMETQVPGLYCAGDVRSKEFRQIVTAVSDGATAAHFATEYVRSILGTTK